MYDPLKAKARVAVFTAAAFLTGLGIASGLGWTHVLDTPELSQTPQISADDVRPALDLSESFVRVADVVTPAVVRIETRRPAQPARVTQDQQDFFRRFFPDGRVPEGFPQQPDGPELSGGSGFVVSADGHILTNNHVVEGSDQIMVYLHDGRNHPARIIGADPFTDVAVIKIDVNESLPHLSMGDSEAVRVGEWVLAVGNPGFAGGRPLDYTVTAGIVSARGRGLQLINRGLEQDPRYGGDMARYAIEDFIQTDAAINPGNSGGPLVDLQGRVIGINSAIASASGFYQGYGFAVPINLAHRVMEDLVAYGHVKRAMLGVSIANIAPEDADQYGLPSVAGALVNEVPANQPAAKAGIRVQDVIVAINGLPVGYPGQLQQRVAQFKPGDEVKVTVYRNRRPMEIEVELAEAPLNEVRAPETNRELVAEARLGIQVEPITEENREQFGYERAGGVVISAVEPGSPAFSRGLVPPFKIVAINGENISDAEDVREILSDVRPGQIVNFRVEGPGGANARVVNVRMPQ
jgi:serine protease Do